PAATGADDERYDLTPFLTVGANTINMTFTNASDDDSLFALYVQITKPPAVSLCGPGPHWVDTCPSGNDTFSSYATIGLDFDFDGKTDRDVLLFGPTTIFRGNPIDTPDPHDPGHVNHINTELVSLDLTATDGSGIKVVSGDGVGNGTCGGPLCSFGAINEQPANSTLADSFFNINFQITNVPILGTLHPESPLHLEAVISTIPPFGFGYTHFVAAPIPLLDSSNRVVAQLVNAQHNVLPPAPDIAGNLTVGGVPTATNPVKLVKGFMAAGT